MENYLLTTQNAEAWVMVENQAPTLESTMWLVQVILHQTFKVLISYSVILYLQNKNQTAQDWAILVILA